MAITGTRVDVGTDANGLLRRLLDREQSGGQLMSLYLNLDPREFATPAARQSEVTALLDEAAREAPDERWTAVIEGLRAEFASADYEIDDAHGLGIIATIEGDVQMLKLGRPVRRRVVFGEHPYLRPVLETMPDTGWCVALVNSRTTRILLGSHDEFHNVKAIRDEVHGRHDQGGWSQARYERGIDEEIKDHVRRAAKELLPLHQAGLFNQLLAGGPEEIRPLFEAALHSYVKPSFAGWVDLDVENATPEEVLAKAMPVIDGIERGAQRELMARLQQEVATDGRGAAGLQPVLDSLNEQRVDTLLIAEGYTAPGVRCRQCGWLGATEGDGAAALAAGTCPLDQGELAQEPDIVECAAEKAIMQSAKVCTVGRDGANAGAAHGTAGQLLEPDATQERPLFLELQGYGSVAALLRF